MKIIVCFLMFVVSVNLFADGVADVLKVQADMRKLIAEYGYTCACNDGKPGFEKMCQYACEAIKLGDYYIAMQPVAEVKTK